MWRPRARGSNPTGGILPAALSPGLPGNSVNTTLPPPGGPTTAPPGGHVPIAATASLRISRASSAVTLRSSSTSRFRSSGIALTAILIAFSMLLRHTGDPRSADAVHGALFDCIESGETTGDLGGHHGTESLTRTLIGRIRERLAAS